MTPRHARPRRTWPAWAVAGAAVGAGLSLAGWAWYVVLGAAAVLGALALIVWALDSGRES